MKNVTVITHPLVQHNLAQLRDKRTQPQEFRRLLGEISSLMIYEATRSLGVKKVNVQTPLAPCAGVKLELEVALVPVLRAGLGMLDAILELIPHARVGTLNSQPIGGTGGQVEALSRWSPNAIMSNGRMGGFLPPL